MEVSVRRGGKGLVRWSPRESHSLSPLLGQGLYDARPSLVLPSQDTGRGRDVLPFATPGREDSVTFGAPVYRPSCPLDPRGSIISTRPAPWPLPCSGGWMGDEWKGPRTLRKLVGFLFYCPSPPLSFFFWVFVFGRYFVGGVDSNHGPLGPSPPRRATCGRPLSNFLEI